MKTFNFILQGHEATEENARNAARGLDWTAEETEDFNLNNSNFIDSINGIDIYYNYAADYYFFSEAEAEEIQPLKIEFSSRRSYKKYALLSVKNSKGLYNVYCQSFGALSGVYCGEIRIHLNIFKAPDLSHVADTINLNNLRFEI